MGGRENSDEAYVLDLCDEVLGEQGLRQHRFEWLLGDSGAAGRRTRLPVDSYWPGHKRLVMGRCGEVGARRSQFVDHRGAVPGGEGVGELGQPLDGCGLVRGVAEGQDDVFLDADRGVCDAPGGDHGAVRGVDGDRPGGLGLAGAVHQVP
jgi:hypothetical protein